MKKSQAIFNPPKERGQSLVEFAISLTFMLILLAGAVDFGIGLFHYTAMRDAAQEGALFGSINPDNTAGILSRIENASGATGLIHDLYNDPVNPLTVSITYSGAHCAGNGITVTLEYHYNPTTPFFGTFSRTDILLRAAVTDTILSPACP